MKVLYIASASKNEDSGVKKKLLKKIQVFNKCGVDTDALFTSSTTSEYEQIENIHYLPTSYNKIPKIYSMPIFWRFHIFYENKIYYRKLAQHLEKHGHLYNYFLFRYPIFTTDINFVRFMKKFGNKIIFEHNTFEIEESKLYCKGAFRDDYKYFSEKNIAWRGIRYAAGLIGVTNEITMYEVKRCKTNINSATISNGFDVLSVPIKKYRDFDGKNINMLFLSGAPAKWHGIDRILNSLLVYEGNININLHIAGDVMKDDNEVLLLLKNKENVSIYLYDFLKDDQLNQLFDLTHIGVGTMGLYTNKMNEACTLKIREYLSRGLPFILGHLDTDLIATEAKEDNINKYYKQFPNDETLIDFSEVIQFYLKFANEQYHNEKIREFAIKYINYDIKIKQVISFIEMIENKLLKNTL